MRPLTKSALLQVVLTFLVSGIAAQLAFGQPPPSVTTANYDANRTNANLEERTLTKANVNSRTFGKLFARPVDGFIYAQPLYLPNLNVNGKGTHNVVFVATMHNSVYAFDADDARASEPLWQINLGPSVPSSVYDPSDIVPEVGILSTPVIDPDAQTLYAVAATRRNGVYGYELHALDVTSGKPRPNSPVAITARVPGSGVTAIDGFVAFEAYQHLQRTGLALAKGKLYIGFGSHADTPHYHGWLMSYQASDLSFLGAFNTTPNGESGSIWQGGRAPVIDAEGNLYLTTANGDYDGQANFSESMLRIPTDGPLRVADVFTPGGWSQMNDEDFEYGSCGPLLIPGTDFLVSGGKSGDLYLTNRNSLGGSRDGDGQVPQHLNPADFGIFNLALWNRADGPLLYLRGYGEDLKQFRFKDGEFAGEPVARNTETHYWSFDGMAVSANGDNPVTGILWTTTAKGPGQPVFGTLHAYDASNVSVELWNSDLVAGRDGLGYFAKFGTPTIANGKVYVPTFSNQLAVYGLLADVAPGITLVTNSASGRTAPLAPGTLVTISGQGFGPASASTAKVDSKNTFPTQLARVQVLFDGVAAPLFYVSANQINTVVPSSMDSKDAVKVEVTFGGKLVGAAVTAPMAATAPGLFALGGSGTGPGAFLNQDGTINTPNAGAERGSIVTLYASGAGPHYEATRDGQLAVGAGGTPSLPVKVTIDGQPAEVLYAGAAPGLVAGMLQINVRVPETAAVSPADLVLLQVGDAESQTNVSLAVRAPEVQQTESPYAARPKPAVKRARR